MSHSSRIVPIYPIARPVKGRGAIDNPQSICWRQWQGLVHIGIPVSVFIAPVVSFINDQDIERIVEAATKAGARSVRYTLIRLSWELKNILIHWLRNYFPDREKKVLSRLEKSRANDRLSESEFFTRMQEKEPWAELIKMRVALASRKFGLTRDRLNLRNDLFVPPRLDGQMGFF